MTDTFVKKTPLFVRCCIIKIKLKLIRLRCPYTKIGFYVIVIV